MKQDIRVVKGGIGVGVVVLPVGKLFAQNLADGFAVAEHTVQNRGVRGDNRRRFLVDTAALVNNRQHRGSDKRNDRTDGRNRREHTVDALAGSVLLIVTDIRLNGRVQNVHERAHKGVEVKAAHNKPNGRAADFGRNRQHHQNEKYVENVGGDQNRLFAPAADTERCEQHAPQRSVAVNGNDNTVNITAARAAVVVKPEQDVGVGGL